MTAPSVITADTKIESPEASDTQSESLDIDYEAEKRLLRKLDWHILPVVAPLYVCSFLDRINIGNARLYGLEEDLNLTGQQFPIALSLFFVTYVLVEIPSNLIIKRVGPSRWIPFITFTWGIVATCTGLAQNFADLVSLRLLLGIFEGGFFPGVALYLTCFYTKKELAMRLALFMMNSSIAGAFGGLLAYAIGYMDGTLGYRGWRWIMILEGIPTCLFATIAFFTLADSPESAKYLTPTEKALLRARQARYATSRTAAAEHLQRSDILLALRDWKLYLFSSAGFCTATMIYGYSTFLPTIIRGLNPSWSTLKVQAMTIPCYTGGIISCLLVAWVSDRLQRRGAVAAAATLVACSGYVVLLTTHGGAAGYAGCMVIPLGMYAASGVCIAWVAVNMPRYGQRAVALAMNVMGVNTGGIMMSYIYPKSEGPQYHRGHSVTLSLGLVAVTIMAFLSWYFSHVNRRRAAGKEDWKAASLTPDQIEELGDRSPHFIYTT
ncbi:High-affinity nicotinic acid transporter protein [Lasiodiplodia theobromae]|uniref:High-affinity nicotinic acid transporter protein n=1 Tax=Lasiodiplodia theobromae TaxID=45133 RepID=UPI0015C40025|nr:High-affinity nicotinic acid transporter protein [Lasiodiplodia theobromae]KAF4545381.1 High-affinity nicotinic acid transporter protein [Lasiodiplodia theobromae]